MSSDRQAFKGEYMRQILRKKIIICVLAVAMLILFFITMGMSTIDDLSIGESFHIFISHLTGQPVEDELLDYIAWDHLVPRAIGAVFVGSALAVAGAVMQSLMRNPLADSYTTGISSGAGLGSTLFFTFGITIIPGLSGMLGLITNSFLVSLIPASLMIIFSMRKRTSPSEIILIGVGVMYLFSAVTTILMLLAEPDNLAGAYTWNLGNMGGSSWDNCWIMGLAAVIGTIILAIMYRQLNITALSDNSAKSYGVNPETIRRIGLIVVSMVVAMVVCFTGTIGFVGLVAPHMVRLVIGSDLKYLIPGSFFAGGVMLLLADAISKLLILPVGVITSIIGGPLFLMLLIKQRKAEAF